MQRREKESKQQLVGNWTVIKGQHHSHLWRNFSVERKVKDKCLIWDS
jgi:hypothetical protein